MISTEDLYPGPNALARHYRRFRVDERLLLTGHSHQAWPDRAVEGQQRAFDDAADLLDDKWDRAMATAERVRRGFARLMEDPDGLITLSASTHDLVVRFLSALPLRHKPRLLTTDGEFHSLRRQLARLEEEGIEVVRVPSVPPEDVPGRLAACLDVRTAAVLYSAVFFETGHIAAPPADLVRACAQVGAELLVDAYHALNVVPFPLSGLGLEEAFVVGGGYKYCQLGEGNAFMRYPRSCRLRPVVTGWFAEFEELERPASMTVSYAADDSRFAGSTYDPTSHYRAGEVLDFFDEQDLTVDLLREVSQHQVGLLLRLVDDLDLPPDVLDRDRTVPLERIAGFVALRSPHAGAISNGLRRHGVHTDHRGDVLRLGPAPYLSDEQLHRTVEILEVVVRDDLQLVP